MSEIAIHTQNLGKSYDGSVYAVHDLFLEIPTGTVFGFLGPNGAGKTTAIKLLTGLLRPTDGSCTVLGLSPQKQAPDLHRLCGVVTESSKMYGHLTGLENMMFFGQAFGLERRESKQRAESLLKSMDLWDARSQKLSAYSTGMSQRLSLARAMIAKPKILFLDEPASGLEPESVRHINSMIASLSRQQGVTVFLCSHRLGFAQSLCDTYGLVNQGSLMACGDLESLIKEVGLPLRARFRLREEQVPQNFDRLSGGWWSKDLKNEEEMPAMVKELVSSGFDVFEAQTVRPTLETIYSKFAELRGRVK